MPLRRTLPFAIALLLASLVEVQAQASPPAEQAPPCIQKFIPLRQEVEKRLGVAKSAIDRKASAAELCRLFTQFSEAEGKMIKYVEEQGVWCGFPPNALPSMKEGHVKSLDARKNACNAAAAGAQHSAAPSLSDALGTPTPDANNVKTGRGTFDTLNGSPLAR